MSETGAGRGDRDGGERGRRLLTFSGVREGERERERELCIISPRLVCINCLGLLEIYILYNRFGRVLPLMKVPAVKSMGGVTVRPKKKAAGR